MSCKKDFLDVTNPATVTREANVYDLNTTSAYLNGVYVNIAKDLFSFGSITAYPEIIADNLKPSGASVPYLFPEYSWSQLSSKNTVDAANSENVNKIWLNGYGIIRACNFVLEKSEEYRSENSQKADNMKAQALAIRAYINFLLVNTFAQAYNFTTDASHPGIPVVTSSDWAAPISDRQTVAGVYNAMIDDLNAAIPLFQAGTPSALTMNKNAAKALLARVYLFKGDYTAAKNTAREVGATVPIMPASSTGYPSKLFTTTETEALFQLSPSNSSSTTFSSVFVGATFVTYNYYLSTADMALLLKQYPSDIRAGWVTSSGTTWKVTKYPQGVIANYTIPAASYYQTIIRSSEMYLTAAEAYAQISNEDSARYYVNQIRSRATLPALPNTVTGASLLDSIYTERRRELCFEGLRMFDLLRWKKGVSRVDVWGNNKSLPYPSNKAIAPLPQQDVEGYQLTQNLDY
ncbi:hypothetical protein A4D02_10800 [Niastella koreensis]|nr:hypothetical protein A4D02_10800 [Niastella koreensis]